MTRALPLEHKIMYPRFGNKQNQEETLTALDLDGTCVIVTGGASGIGRGIVDTVIEHGGRAAVWDIDEGRLRKTATIC